MAVAALLVFVGGWIFSIWNDAGRMIARADIPSILAAERAAATPPIFRAAFAAAEISPQAPSACSNPFGRRATPAAVHAERVIAYTTRLDRTLHRGFIELAAACQLELRFSEEEILTIAVRGAYFGRKAFGADAGAQAWFGKSLPMLSIAEHATLASKARAPNNPPDPARRDRILAEMRRSGVIDAAQLETARREPLVAISASTP